VNARAGADHLLASIGLVGDGDHTVVQRDSYVRHHREQLVGASLAVRGGVLDVSTERLRTYEELVNVDTGDVAATFILSFESAGRTDRARRPIGAEIVEAASERTTALPDHGRPRSVSLDHDPAAHAPSLDEARRLGLAVRQVREIDPTECDDDGFVRTLAVPELVWGGEPVPERQFRPLEELADGGQMGFATMETRATWVRPARAGDHIQSFGAELDLRDKTMLSRHWLFDVDRGELIAVFSVLNVAFDIARRRAIMIPAPVRDRLATRLHPELGDS
jgi:acyl-CoA thioesterase FadM